MIFACFTTHYPLPLNKEKTTIVPVVVFSLFFIVNYFVFKYFVNDWGGL